MIITLKAKINTISDDILPFQRQFNNVVKWAYNRFKEGKSRTDVFGLIRDNNVNNVDLLDVTWKREAAKLAQTMYLSSKDKNKPIVFYSKAFRRRLEGKTTREEFIKERDEALYQITCEGSKADTDGNRKFKFDANELSGSVKLGKETVTFSCERIGKKRQDMLVEYLEMAHIHMVGVTYKITPKYLYILVDLKDIVPNTYDAIEGRTLALDMNPNYIGLSIVDSDDTIIHKRVYNLSKVPKEKYKQNHELTEVAISIAKLCKHFKVCLVGFEKLSMKSSDKGRGRSFNRLVNNGWRRDRFLNSLRKHLELVGCPYKEVVASYSSFVGCVCYPSDTDSVAASLELNRRLRLIYKMYVLKTMPIGGVIFPQVGADVLNRWKDEAHLCGDITDWLSFYSLCKMARHSYRRLYGPWLKTAEAKEFRLYSAVSSGVLVLPLPCNEILCFN